MNVLIAGLDVKRAGSNKRALTKKEDDHLETKEESEDRIPNMEKWSVLAFILALPSVQEVVTHFNGKLLNKMGHYFMDIK